MSPAGESAHSKVYDVIVIGLGVMGVSALSAVARIGASVLGIEQFSPPHSHGSSHGETRLLRVAYAEGAAYVPMMLRAVEGWRALEQRTGTALFSQSGVLYLAPPGSALLASVEKSATSHRIELRPNEKRASFRTPSDWRAVIEPGAGYLKAEESVAGFLADARAHGAELRTNALFKSVERHGPAYRVTTNTGSFQARKVICCLGAWTRDAFAFLKPHIRLEQHVLHWHEASEDFDLGSGFLPFVLAPDERQFLYGNPRVNGAVKLADHYSGTALSTPAALGSYIPAGEFAHAQMAVQTYLPSLGPRLNFKPCIYDLSPDEHFILDEHPEMPGVWFFTGSSGHGFKFAPVIGEALANAALERPQAIDVGFFSLKRFDR